MAPLVRTGGSRHTGLAALPHRNIQKANEMTKIQTEVARNSSLPNIQVVEKNLINEKTGKTDDSIIQISNLNGRLNNYESRIVTFLKCSYLDNKNNVYEEEIPIFNYSNFPHQ